MSALKTLAESFFSFERRHGLFKELCLEQPFWDYVRFDVFESLALKLKVRGELMFPSRRTGKPWLRRSAEEVLGATAQFMSSLGNGRAVSCDAVIFDCPNYKLVEGHLANAVTYPAVAALSGSAVTIFDADRFSDHDPARYPCSVASTRFDYLASRFGAARTTLPEREVARLIELDELILKELGARVGLSLLVNDGYVYQRLLLDRLTARLESLRPKIIVFQNDGKKVAAHCASRLGIVSVELQHGATHPYDLLSSYGVASGPKNPTVPDHILTYGPYWNDKFVSPAAKHDVGSPYFETTVAALLPRSIRREPRSVLGVSVLDHGLARCLFRFAELRRDYTVYYKLKSEEYSSWRSLYPSDMQHLPNFRFIADDTISMPERLLGVESVVTSCSTAIYEALHLGPAVFIFRGWSYEQAEDLPARGLASFVQDGDELADIIGRAQPPAASVRGLFYKDDSPAHLKEALAVIMNAPAGRQ